MLGIFAGLELLGKFQFALGVFGAAEVTVGEAEKVVGDIVVGIHCNGALQGANGELSFAFFLKNFAEKNVRAGGSGIEPDGALQELFGFVKFLRSGVGVGEFVVGGRIAGVDSQFLFELCDGFGNFGLVEIEFAEQLMRERELGIEFDGFFAVFFGDGAEIQTKKKARSEKISCRGIRRDLKHFCEGGASAGVIFGLDVGNAENIGGVDAGAGIPGLHFFEIGNGFGWFACEIERKTGELGCFSIVGIFGGGALQCGNGVGIIAFAVIDDAEFAGEIFCGGIGLGNFCERGEGFVELALVGEMVNLVEGRRSGWRIG